MVAVTAAGHTLGEVHQKVGVQRPKGFQDSLMGKEIEIYLKQASSTWQTAYTHLLSVIEVACMDLA